MFAGDNFLSLSQNYFSPDIVQKFSEQIGLSLDKTKSALKSVIPAFLSGVIEKGSTPEGAASLVNMVNTHNFEESAKPDASKLSEGTEVVNDIFGSNLNNVVSKLNTSTGIDSSSIKKIMSLAAPGFMGFIAAKVKSEKLGSSGLMSFLSSQKSTLASLSSLGSLESIGGKVGSFQKQISASKIPWKTIALAAVVLLGILYWWFNVRSKVTTSVPVATVEKVVTAMNRRIDFVVTKIK